MSQKIKAFGMVKEGEIGWWEIDKPVCGDLDVICKPIALAPCTSDVHTVWEGGLRGIVDEYAVLGHEAIGEIVEVGAAVRDFKVGDRVIVGAATPDWLSLEAQENIVSHEHGFFAGNLKFTNQKPGVFAELFHVNAADFNLVKLPEDMSLETAIMITDMIPTGFAGVENADIQFGDTVLVMGIGPVGLMSVVAAKLKGAARILAIGSRPNCVELAKEYGATEVINYKEFNVLERVMELTNNKGADKVVVTTEGVNNDSISQATAMCKFGGTISNVAYFGSRDDIPLSRLAWGLGMGDKTIKGYLGRTGRVKVQRFTDMISCGRFDPSKLVTHKFTKFEDIEQALLSMKDKPRDLIKSVIILED